MSQDYMAAGRACLGALGLHHAGEPRETAAALAVWIHWSANKLKVVTRKEGNRRGSAEAALARGKVNATAANRRRVRDMVTFLELRDQHYASNFGPCVFNQASC